jgi:DnaD/phage-associated family protein
MKGIPEMSESFDWNSPYLNRNSWLLYNLDKLDVTPQEALVLLVVNFINENGLSMRDDYVSSKCRMTSEQLDDCLESLSAKGYLEIKVVNARVEFNLAGVMQSQKPEPKTSPADSSSLLKEFSMEFARPLSGTEMERILQMADSFEESMILRALDEAAMYDKRSIAYVEKVLASWKEKGLSAEDVENGKR